IRSCLSVKKRQIHKGWELSPESVRTRLIRDREPKQASNRVPGFWVCSFQIRHGHARTKALPQRAEAVAHRRIVSMGIGAAERGSCPAKNREPRARRQWVVRDNLFHRLRRADLGRAGSASAPAVPYDPVVAVIRKNAPAIGVIIRSFAGATNPRLFGS